MSALKKILPQLRDFVRRADMFLFTVSVICAIYGIIVIASATKSYDNGSAQYVIVRAWRWCWASCFSSPSPS